MEYNRSTDALAGLLIMVINQLDTTKADVAEALLLALVRYVGPIQFAALVSSLKPSKD